MSIGMFVNEDCNQKVSKKNNLGKLLWHRVSILRKDKGLQSFDMGLQ